MRTELRQLLLGEPGIAGVVKRRINWDEVPQGENLPDVVMFLVSSVPDYHHGGPSGLVESRVQINSRSTKVDEAAAIDAAIEAVLSGMKDRVQDGTVFQAALKVMERSEFEDDGPRSLFTTMSDYRIWSGSAA